MRYIAAQFDVYLRKDIWKTNAVHANLMAQKLYGNVSRIPEVKVTQQVEANGIFAVLPHDIIVPLQEMYFFYVWDDKQDILNYVKKYYVIAEN